MKIFLRCCLATCLLTIDACGTAEAPRITERQVRGTTPLEAGTCNNACGGQANDGNCGCDQQCGSYGDCCSDADEHCDPSEIQPN